jgi:hypothetical protein
MGVQHVVRFFPADFSKEFLVELLDGGVLVRATIGPAFVDGVERRGACAEQFLVEHESSRGGVRLAAAADASAGAGHDFDDVVLFVAARRFFEQFAGVDESVRDADVQRDVAENDLRLA